MIDIVSIRNHKIKYNNHNDIKFESLDFYLNLAQKTISKLGKNISNTLSKEMLASEDAISNVANCLMMADWRWDKNRIGEHGTAKTRYSYRNQCAIWAIKSYITRKKHKNHINYIDNISNINDHSLDILNIIPNKDHNPLDILINEESHKEKAEELAFYMNVDNNILTDKQSQCLKMYYFDEMTFADIGKIFNITREAVRQNIKRAINKIQKYKNQYDKTI